MVWEGDKVWESRGHRIFTASFRSSVGTLRIPAGTAAATLTVLKSN